jgi:flagellin-like hook-associated protein FlgL
MANGVTGDLYRNRSLVVNLNNVRAEIEVQNKKISTNKKFEKLREVGGNAVFIKRLQETIKGYESYIENNQSALSLRVAAYENSAKGLMNIITEVKSRIIEINGIKKDAEPYQVLFSQYLQSVAALVNVQVGTSYVFSGSASSVVPVDLSKLPDLIDPTDVATPHLEYYQGTNTRTAAPISDDLTLDYQVVGSNSAIEKTIRALKMLNTSALTPNDERMSAAQKVIEEASTECAILMADIGAKSAFLNSFISQQQDELVYVLQSYSKVMQLDDAEAITQLKHHSHILEMSYGTYKITADLSLAKYLS